MVAFTREPWNGDAKTLLIAIDVGTTFTAASFCILQPGVAPAFQEVLRWPKQTISEAKVPSVLFYDRTSRPQAFGAETTDDEVLFEAESGEWKRAEWWKLHLRPPHVSIAGSSAIPPLPRGVTVDIILSDFLKYVKDQVQAYFSNSHGNGAEIWNILYPSMKVVLTTPNGWEGSQQQRMRAAAVAAGLVDARGSQRVRFVSEAEAAILFAIDSGCIGDWLTRNGHVILCDCGGGTIDTTSYRVVQVKPLVLEEISTPRCSLVGAVFVTAAFKEYIQEHLKGTEWADSDIIARAVTHFDQNAKRKFEDVNSPSWVDLGSFKNVPSLSIVRGKLKVPGETMAKFFEKSLDSIKANIVATYEQGHRVAQKVVLVGGLSSSPYVFKSLMEWGLQHSLALSRPDGPMSKAVANGALSWFIHNPVSARLSRYHYGVEVNALYDPNCEDMEDRPTFRNRRGEVRVESSWSCIVPKDTVVQSGQEHHQAYRISWSEGQTNFTHRSDVFAFRGEAPPRFLVDVDSSKLRAGFELVCSVSANLQAAYETAPLRVDPQGRRFRDVAFEICIRFGETELSARIRWADDSDDGHVHGPATISYLPIPPEAADDPPPYAS